MAQAIELSKRVAFTSWQGWGSHANASISIDDYGFLQGATAVDRLRTCNGELLDLEEHYCRLLQGCKAIGVEADRLKVVSIIEECVALNRPVYGQQDFSVAIIVTPGRLGPDRSPTVVVHTSPIDWPKLHEWYTQGQSLEFATHRNVPAECWSPAIKTRSRLQYFLADQNVSQEASGAILLSTNGLLTETSVANLLIVEGDDLVSPQHEIILPGISLQRTARLASKAGIEVRYEPISEERAKKASGLILTGTVGCIWHCNALDGVPLRGDAVFNGVYQRLQQLWQEDIGMDFELQAKQFAYAAA